MLQSIVVCCGVLLKLIGLQFECVAEYCSLLQSTFKVYFCVANQKTKCVEVCRSVLFSLCVRVSDVSKTESVAVCVAVCAALCACVAVCVAVCACN